MPHFLSHNPYIFHLHEVCECFVGQRKHSLLKRWFWWTRMTVTPEKMAILTLKTLELWIFSRDKNCSSSNYGRVFINRASIRGSSKEILQFPHWCTELSSAEDYDRSWNICGTGHGHDRSQNMGMTGPTQ